MKVEKRTLLSVEDLIKFCEEKNLYEFNSKNHGYKLSVQVPALFEIEEDVDDAHRGMLKLKIRIFHLGLNRNGSYVSEESAKDAMPTIKNRPVLAAIHQLDNGDWDFEGHNYEIVKHDDGTEELVYIERQVGSFDESEPFFEYDEEYDKTYVCGYAYIAEEYTKASEIIRRKNGTKNSCELSIEEFSYNAKEKYLNLQKFYVSASTLLGAKKDGTQIGEGMLGSRADIEDFSEKNNSQHFDINQELLSEIKKLNEKLSHFNIDKLEEGGNILVTKFEELLNKYNKTVEDITFDYENLSEEELEIKFEELFGEEDTDGEGAEPESTSEGEQETGEETTVDENNEESAETNEEENEEENTEVNESDEETDGTTDEDKTDDVVVESDFEEKTEVKEIFVKKFEISHEDVRYALYGLLSAFEELDNDWYWISNVYDSYFVYENWDGSKIFRQGYTKENDNVSFDGERVELFKELLTASEKAELDAMRSNYSLITTKLEKYEEKELEELKEALFDSKDYSSISDKEEFVDLKKEMKDFSIEELKTKLDSIILDYAKKGSLKFTEGTVSTKGKVNLPVKNNKKSRYGSLFNK